MTSEVDPEFAFEYPMDCEKIPEAVLNCPMVVAWLPEATWVAAFMFDCRSSDACPRVLAVAIAKVFGSSVAIRKMEAFPAVWFLRISIPDG